MRMAVAGCVDPWSGSAVVVVQPVRVVDHAQDRPDLGGIREQRQHRQADQERIRRRPARQLEGHTQRPPLRLGQPVHGGQERDKQLVDSGKAQSHFRLDCHRPDWRYYGDNVARVVSLDTAGRDPRAAGTRARLYAHSATRTDTPRAPE